MVRRTPNYCPYCGASLVVRPFEGRDRRYCENCEAFVWQDSAPVAAVGIRDGDRVFLQKRAVPPGAGKWGFPGGFTEPDEDPREGAARELREETGLEVPASALELFEATVFDGGEEPYVLWIQFTAPREAVEGDLSLSGEASEARFWSVPAFERSDEEMSPEFRELFERIAAE